jgi:hypothetical protein
MNRREKRTIDMTSGGNAEFTEAQIASVIKLQAVYKGYIVRKQLNKLRAEVKEVISILFMGK